jgi:hypothetical protein
MLVSDLWGLTCRLPSSVGMADLCGPGYRLVLSRPVRLPNCCKSRPPPMRQGGRSDYGMGLAPQRSELELKIMQGTAGQANHLIAILYRKDAPDPKCVYDPNRSIIFAIGGRPPGVNPVFSAWTMTAHPAAMLAQNTRHCSTRVPGRITASAVLGPDLYPVT